MMAAARLISGALRLGAKALRKRRPLGKVSKLPRSRGATGAGGGTGAGGAGIDVGGVLTAGGAATGATVAGSAGAAGAAGAEGWRAAHPWVSRLLTWKGMVGVAGSYAMASVIEKLTAKEGVPAALKGADRGQLKELLAQLRGTTDPPLTRATEEVAGLDRMMLLEREIASQAPLGTAPATPFVDRQLRGRLATISADTPIVDRIQVLNADLLTTLRKRMSSRAGGLWSDLSSGEILIDGNQAPPSRAQIEADKQQLELTLREELGFRQKTPIDMLALMG